MTSLFSSYGLPKIQTRKALLLLDFQNDFVRPSGALHVPNTADFLDNLPHLAQAFRRVGDVIWVRSHFEERRSLWDPDSHADRVVLATCENESNNKEAQDEHDIPEDEEAFLSADSPKCCRPKAPGIQFPAPILAAIDPDRDTVLDKSEYSALQDGGLVLSFRTRFITELYLCGSLSNVSVYATTLDAVRRGFSVTLIEDCLGFRNFARHEEAMRRMADILGANGITTDELYEELDWQETDAIARKSNPEPIQPAVPAGIEKVMDKLDFNISHKPAKLVASGKQPAQPPEDSQRRALDVDSEGEMTDEDVGVSELLKYTRARYAARGSPGLARAPVGETKVLSRVRNQKRHEPKAQSTSQQSSRRDKRKLAETYLGPGDVIGERDSRIIYDLDLPPDAFEKIRDEVAWQKMYHMFGQVPRLVAVQGECKSDGSIPIYRHPADEAPPLLPFTRTVDQIRVIVERILGHPLNHVLIQLYRDGQDRISEHSDKTLDIVRGSFICNVSVGAQRVMILRTKSSTTSQSTDDTDSGRQTQRIPLPHESLFILGQKTNMRWLHGIRPDKRPDSARSAEERAYGGERISLTFRHIGTFTNQVAGTIWGQGAISKLQDGAGAVIHGDPVETERLIRAFGQENHATEFDWDATYGSGFDVVNFVTASTARLVPSRDAVADLRVRLCLGENGQRYTSVVSDVSGRADDDKRPLYMDPDGTVLSGDVNILTHLAQRLPARPGVDMLRGGAQLPQIEGLLTGWREYLDSGRKGEFNLLDVWEECLALDGRHYLSGGVFGIDDCSLWPVLREIEQESGLVSGGRYPNLQRYYHRVGKRGCVKVVLEEMEQL